MIEMSVASTHYLVAVRHYDIDIEEMSPFWILLPHSVKSLPDSPIASVGPKGVVIAVLAHHCLLYANAH